MGKLLEHLKDIDACFGKYDIDTVVAFIKQKSDLIKPESEDGFKIKSTNYIIREIKINKKLCIRINEFLIPYDKELIQSWNDIRSGKKKEIMDNLKTVLDSFDTIKLDKNILTVNEEHKLYFERQYEYDDPDDWPMGTDDFSNPIIGCYYKDYKIEDVKILEIITEILHVFDEDVMLVGVNDNE